MSEPKVIDCDTIRIFRKQNVFDAALDRIRFLFDEFPNIRVSVSGGKDSDVIFQLSLIVAREKNRLPLTCVFLDQEVEWTATIDHMRYIMYHPDVKPMWYQIPFRIVNATSQDDPYLDVWGEGKDDVWMREKEDIAIKENKTNCDLWSVEDSPFRHLMNVEFGPDAKVANIIGMRAEENPTRFMCLTGKPCYKWVTWGGEKGKNYFTFNPIYDWSYRDVWKAIHENKWPYNVIYDAFYRYGVRIQEMRVSNLQHETAINSLFMLQELEPDTWERIVERIRGIDSATKFGRAEYFPRTLPTMFKSWIEYRDYLLEKLILREDWLKRFKRRHARLDKKYPEPDLWLCRIMIKSILANDWEGIFINHYKVNEIYKKNYTVLRAIPN